MTNCIIVDDDPIALNILKQFVANTFGLNLLAEFTNGLEATNYLRNDANEVDLVFLDMEMPEMSGTDLLASFTHLPPIIVISSEEKYAITAYDHGVVHYLVKPVEYNKFLKAIERATSSTTKSNEVLLDYVIVKDEGIFKKLDYKDIMYFEALGDYVKVHTKDKVYVVNSTMKRLMDKVISNPQFIRIHRSYIINLIFLENFDGATAIVAKKFIPIGEKFKVELQQRLNIL